MRLASAVPLLLLATLTLAACASRPPMPVRAAGVPSEKDVLRILTQLQASDSQRSAVLAAFDAALPRLWGLQAERAALQAQLRDLVPQQPGYLERSQALAQQWGDLHRREVEAYASYEAAVAAALSEAQWRHWREATTQRAFEAPAPRGGGGGGGMRRRTE